MNIAFFLTPKNNVMYLYNDFTVRQGLEKMRHHGFSAIPVITRDNKYLGTISEGDFLWKLVGDADNSTAEVSLKSLEELSIGDLVDVEKNPPVRITANAEDLLSRVLRQTFVPVIDDNDSFIGIVTRRVILKHLYEKAQGKTLT